VHLLPLDQGLFLPLVKLVCVAAIFTALVGAVVVAIATRATVPKQRIVVLVVGITIIGVTNIVSIGSVLGVAPLPHGRPPRTLRHLLL
jgi:hypothetical protein